MQKDNNTIAYIYKRKIIDEDNDYITYTYTLEGVAVGKEEELGNYSYTFTPDATMCSNENLIDKTFVSIDDPACLTEEYVYCFPSYLADMKEEEIQIMYEKSIDETMVIKDYILCQVYTKGSTSINTQYIDPERFELTDISTDGIEGIISIFANKHDKVHEVKEIIRDIYDMPDIHDPKTKENQIYANEIYQQTSKTVICQDEQIKEIAATIAKNQRIKTPALKDNLLICGPTGVGKTEIFRCIGKQLDIPVINEDSTEYTAAGYVGKSVTDMLYNLYLAANGDIKKAERGIIIADEIDKKVSGNSQHEVYTTAVLDALLKMSEGHKYHIETKNCQFDIDTSFITFVFSGAFSGIEEFNERKRKLGFTSQEDEEEAVKTTNSYTEQNLIKYGLKPEFLGRNTLIVMNSLDIEDFKKIITESDKSVLLLYKYLLEEIGIKLIYDESCIEAIAIKAKELGVGARSIKKIIEKAFKIIKYQVFSEQKYSELIITPETFEDNTKFTLK